MGVANQPRRISRRSGLNANDCEIFAIDPNPAAYREFIRGLGSDFQSVRGAALFDFNAQEFEFVLQRSDPRMLSNIVPACLGLRLQHASQHPLEDDGGPPFG